MERSMERYLSETPLLDFHHGSLAGLMRERGWEGLPLFERIGAIYDFVRNEIPFGYNASDDIPASSVLRDGYGQCNTKGTLLMALLRAAGVPCRFHGFTIEKRLQRGAITGLAYRLAPASIIHSWVELRFEGRWIDLEGFILDDAYLDGVRCLVARAEGELCAYAIGTADLANPPVEWEGEATYIQSSGINHDYGVFDAPDAFYARHGSNLSGLRRLLYAHLLRHRINARVARIRRATRPVAAARAASPGRGARAEG